MTKLSIIKTVILSTMFACSFSTQAGNYGVNLKWDSGKKQQAMKKVPSDGPTFASLVKNGDIKEVYIQEKREDGKTTSFVNFVIEAETKEHVKSKLSQLPLYQQGIIEITAIAPVGSKWLDATPTYKNYSLSFYWKDGIDAVELNRVLGIDLQRVVALNQAGLVTSSYIHTQDEGSDYVKPVYLISILADSEAHAIELSEQFESVNKGYVDIEVKHLGRKLKLEN